MREVALGHDFCPCVLIRADELREGNSNAICGHTEKYTSFSFVSLVKRTAKRTAVLIEYETVEMIELHWDFKLRNCEGSLNRRESEPI